MSHGVTIKSGPSNWQILQQVNGKADISLSGTYYSLADTGIFTVYARIVKEDMGEPVLRWQECSMSDTNNREGTWSTVLRDIPAGGLYRLETCLNHNNSPIEWSGRGDMIHHIGVGDLYVIAGQSNSSGYGKDFISDPSEKGVHVLRNSGLWDLATHPLNESTGSIHPVNTEWANPGHSPYLNFAKVLKRELGYPIGLLQSALGGSPLSLWNPDEDGALYKNMMDIIKSQGGKVKGILWYQGCSDTGAPMCETYYKRFENMVRHVRNELSDPDLPFLTVQLNRHITPVKDEMSDRGWGLVREAQRQAAHKIPGIYVIPANDATLSDWIHISAASNMVLGERLARTALSEIYGKSCCCKAPDIKRAAKSGQDKIILEFDNVYERIDALGVPAGSLPFTVVDEKGKIDIVEYHLPEPDKITMTLDRPMEGKTVIHGAYEANPAHFLPYDVETHLPVLSFYGVVAED